VDYTELSGGVPYRDPYPKYSIVFGPRFLTAYFGNVNPTIIHV